MTSAIHSPAGPMALAPRGERIEALDVVRGFALIGILLMNIEYFNRATQDFAAGIQPGLSGANYWFSWFVQYCVVGKFWTIFSLLFGMGFAVMLMRAEAAQRSFFVPYLRRIAALALFGVLHYILFWPGDILFSYAVGAVGLLTVLFGRANYILPAIAALCICGAAAGWDWPFVVASCLAYFGACAWYLRAPERITMLRRSVPVFRIITSSLMATSAAALIAGLLAPALPHQQRIALVIGAAAVLMLSILMLRCHQPGKARPWRIGVGLYVFITGLMVCFSGAQYYYPDPTDALVANMPVPASLAKQDATAKPKTDIERALERKRERAKQRAENKAEVDAELRVLTAGTYAQAVDMRAKDFVKGAPEQLGFATMIVTLFLLGTWFVRSGVIANTGAHLPLFRKLALIALPVGLGLGLLGSTIATGSTPDVDNGFDLAFGLLMLGNLPACLGYVSLVVLMLHSRSSLSGIRVLAPLGRMALTNYLTHSVVFTTIFYGYGLGYFGIERIWQFACVVAMVALQIPFSHWWLGRFRYGPMEWLWRAIPYWQIPPMRLALDSGVTAKPQPVP